MKKILCTLLCTFILINSVPVFSYANEVAPYTPSGSTSIIQDVAHLIGNEYITWGADQLTNVVTKSVTGVLDMVENGLSNFVRRPVTNISPSVEFYNDFSLHNANNVLVENNHNDYSFIGKIYNDNSTHSTNNFKMEYINNNNHYTYNPIYNRYDVTNNAYYTFDYSTNNYDYSTYYYSDDDYYYSVTNNYTNYTYVISPKESPNDLLSFSYFYRLPNGGSSFNLTKDDVLGVYFNYNAYKYEQTSEDEGLICVYDFDGDKAASFDKNGDTSFSYMGNVYGNGKFGQALRFNGADYPVLTHNVGRTNYEMNFWFYNGTDNNLYGSNSAHKWIYCSYQTVNGNEYVWFDGIPFKRGTTDFSFSYVQERTAPTVPNGTTITKPFAPYSYGVIPYGQSFNPSMPSRYHLYTISSTDYGITFDSRLGNNTDFWGTTDGTSNSLYLSYATTSRVNTSLHRSPYLNSNNVEFEFAGTNNLNKKYPLAQGFYDYIVATTTLVPDSSGAFSWVSFNATTQRRVINVSNVSIADMTKQGYALPNNTYFDMSDCYIDNLWITTTFTHTPNQRFDVSQSKFEGGFIWARPSGSFNDGDLAFQTLWDIGTVRVGGAKFVYPTQNAVYVSLNDDIAVKAEIYHDGYWFEIPFAVWNNNQWNDGIGYSFSSMTWGQKLPSETIDINIDITNLEDYDGAKTFDFIKSIPTVLGALIAFIGSLGILPLSIIGGFTTFVVVLVTLIGIKLLKK